MKILYSKKKLIFISCSLLFVNISMANSESPWNTIDQKKKKENCTDCRVDLNLDEKDSKDKKDIAIEFTDAPRPSQLYHNNGYNYKIKASDINSKTVKFIDKAYVVKESKSHIKRVAIQLGAFRLYSGAKKYVKKYAILSSKYKITINAGAKNQKPIYRVRVEGFSSRTKAEEFKKQYGLRGAFLVMK